MATCFVFKNVMAFIIGLCIFYFSSCFIPSDHHQCCVVSSVFDNLSTDLKGFVWNKLYSHGLCS